MKTVGPAKTPFVYVNGKSKKDVQFSVTLRKSPNSQVLGLKLAQNQAPVKQNFEKQSFAVAKKHRKTKRPKRQRMQPLTNAQFLLPKRSLQA